jgi:hypothetical protein
MVARFHATNDLDAFLRTMQGLIDLVPPVGIYAGDNLFTYYRNLGFLEDQRFLAAFNKHTSTDTEKSIAWRLHTLCWAARRVMRLDGDLVECACYKGTSARIVADYVDLEASGKSLYLYDLFDHSDDMPHHRLEAHSATLYDAVVQRFSDLSRVHVTQGRVPDTLREIAPEKIAFLHLDLNNAAAEIGALEFLFDRVVPGGSIVFDDYGWRCYREQKIVEDAFLAARDYQVLELPTGQGLLIK